MQQMDALMKESSELVKQCHQHKYAKLEYTFPSILFFLGQASGS
jgi:hypothetical protein